MNGWKLQRRLRPLVWSPQASSACVRQARRLAGQRLLKKPGECGRKKSSPSRSCRRAFSRARSAERLQVLQGRRSSITGAKSPPTSADWAALACSSKMGAEFHSRNARHKGHLQVSCGPRIFGVRFKLASGSWAVGLLTKAKCSSFAPRSIGCGQSRTRPA